MGDWMGDAEEILNENLKTIMDWFRRCKEVDLREDICKKIMVLWAIWNERNKVFHGGEEGCPKTILDGALRYHKTYSESAGGMMVRRKAGNGETHSTTWIAPPEGWWKINVDAATFDEQGCGMGVVIRDHNGEVGRAAVKQVRTQWSVEIIEAKAALLGVNMAIQMGVTKVIIESDCLQLVNALKKNEVQSNYFGNVVSEVLSLLNSFISFSFSFVKREGNYAAHGMAHYTPLDFSTRIWVDMCPDTIGGIVASDAMSEFT
ncbi:uncharacterized protein LOC141587475 [Silene latifolia]|uniref:uncharacterized protein LOC141587475 n=1 Tax=Silene latifolia TaxID=37657 RepID=UPI003D77C76F